MKLTQNEKKIMKLLLNNSRITDSEMAVKLNISSQAVGKIRKKLEESVIDSYSLNLNYSKLGIGTFAIAKAKLTSAGLDKGELEIEQKLVANPQVINVYRIPQGNITHIILYGFLDIGELDDFFHSSELKQELHQFIETQTIYTFSHNSLIKNDPVQLFHKVIDNSGTESSRVIFNELENFKKRL